MKNNSAKTGLIAVACILYVISVIMLFKGCDKMTHYDPYEGANEYVGNDEGNLIINANYATGFFVLSMGFLMTGSILLAAGIVIGAMPDTIVKTVEVKYEQPKRSNEFCVSSGNKYVEKQNLSWKCSSCGNENEAGNAFCGSCGSKKPEIVEEVREPEIKKVTQYVGTDRLICPYCGREQMKSRYNCYNCSKEFIKD